MNERKLCGIRVCLTYALLGAISVALPLSGLVTHSGVIGFLLNWPIRLQIFVADAIGFGPLLVWMSCAIGRPAPYAVLVAATFCALYWIGWWIARLKEDS